MSVESPELQRIDETCDRIERRLDELERRIVRAALTTNAICIAVIPSAVFVAVRLW